MYDLLAGRRKPVSIYPFWTLSRNRVHDTELASLTHPQGTVRFAYLKKNLFSREAVCFQDEHLFSRRTVRSVHLKKH